MKITNGTNNEINNNATKYLKILCNEKPDIVLKTEFGTGRYQFVEFKMLSGDVMLQFKLLKDSKYNDTPNIYNHIGDCCFLTIEQYLFSYSYCGTA